MTNHSILRINPKTEIVDPITEEKKEIQTIKVRGILLPMNQGQMIRITPENLLDSNFKFIYSSENQKWVEPYLIWLINNPSEINPLAKSDYEKYNFYLATTFPEANLSMHDGTHCYDIHIANSLEKMAYQSSGKAMLETKTKEKQTLEKSRPNLPAIYSNNDLKDLETITKEIDKEKEAIYSKMTHEQRVWHIIHSYSWMKEMERFAEDFFK